MGQGRLKHSFQQLCYLRGTLSLGISYFCASDGPPVLLGYCDSDYAADATDRKSVNGYIFFLGSCIISWMSKKQDVVAVGIQAYAPISKACKCYFFLF